MTKKENKTVKKTKKPLKQKPVLMITSIFFLLVMLMTVYIIYAISLLNGIENTLRLVGSIFLLLFLFGILCLGLKTIRKRTKKLLVSFLIITVTYSFMTAFIGFHIIKAYSKVENMNTNHTIYSSSLIAMKEGSLKELSDVTKETIGILNDQNSVDGYQMPNEIIKKQKWSDSQIKKYEDYTSLLYAFYHGEVDLVFLPTNYPIMFASIEEYKTIEEKTKILYTQTKKVKKSSTTSVSKKNQLDKPFTVLLMGVDSTEEDINGSTPNGDSLMLITFNPKTLNTTMLSIPRDSYVPISCFPGKKKNKITHAAWYGEECMIKTIEDLTSVPIDYYVKMNFKGVTKLVDALGGVEVDVPYSFCEQNSNREWGSNTVYVKKGIQTLNGEQALALARNRHPNPDMCSSEWTDYTSNDFVRGQNQQLIVRGLLEKIKNIRDLDTIYKLLDTVSKNLDTNFSTPEILSFYNVGKDVLIKSANQKAEEILGIQKLYLSGYDAYIYDTGMQMELYDYVLYQGSINDVTEAMKINLELVKPNMQKHFAFSMSEKYEEIVIGKGNYNENNLSQVPNFVGKDVSVAQSWASRNGIRFEVEYITVSSNTYQIGQITKQNLVEGTNIEDINSPLKVSVVEKIKGNATDIRPNDPHCELDENKENSKCQLPNFVGEDISIIEQFKKSTSYTIYFNLVELKDGDEGYDPSAIGKIISQDVAPETNLYDLNEKTIKIVYISDALDPVIPNPDPDLDPETTPTE